MSDLRVNTIGDSSGSGPVATLPTSGGSAFTLGPNWGAWEFVSTAAITAVANLNVTGIAAGYDYLFQLEAFAPTTDLGILFGRASTDGGSAYLSGATDYRWVESAVLDNSDSELAIYGTQTAGNDAGNLCQVGVLLVNPGGTGENMMARWVGTIDNQAATPNIARIIGGGAYIGATTAVNAFQFGWSTNYGTDTFKAQGDITVWRRRRS